MASSLMDQIDWGKWYQNNFGVTEEVVKKEYEVTPGTGTDLNELAGSLFGTDPEAFVMSMLSDAQELLASNVVPVESIRRLLNRAKYILESDRQAWRLRLQK